MPVDIDVFISIADTGGMNLAARNTDKKKDAIL